MSVIARVLRQATTALLSRFEPFAGWIGRRACRTSAREPGVERMLGR
jgi:hypothetical protein